MTARLTVLAVMWVGCVAPLVVGYTAPHPHVELTPKKGVRLHLDMRRVPDELISHDGVRDVSVHDWRGTLAAGYANSLRESFPHVSGLPVLTVELQEATPIFGPAVEGIYVQLRFRARLLDSAGNVLKRSAGTVEPKIRATEASLTPALGSAVETMFEQIAADLLADL